MAPKSKGKSSGKFSPNFGATIKTLPGKLIFPSVAYPSAMEGSKDEKYSASLILKPSDRLTELLNEINKVGLKSFPDWNTGDYYHPIITGEACMEKSDKCKPELYEGNYRLITKLGIENFKGAAIDPPACYLADGSKMPRRPGNEEDLKAIEAQFYPGCYCMVAVTPMTYVRADKAGVSLLFKAIRFIKDGTRLAGADVEALMTADEDIGSDYDFDDETGLGTSEVDEANV